GRHRNGFARLESGSPSPFVARLVSTRGSGRMPLFDELSASGTPVVADTPLPADASPTAGSPAADASSRPAATVRPEPVTLARGEKGKARDLIAAIRCLKTIDRESRAATPEERQVLARFAGFGPVALSIFPDPATGRYKDGSWQQLGEELQSLLTPDE